MSTYQSNVERAMRDLKALSERLRRESTGPHAASCTTEVVMSAKAEIRREINKIIVNFAAAPAEAFFPKGHSEWISDDSKSTSGWICECGWKGQNMYEHLREVKAAEAPASQPSAESEAAPWSETVRGKILAPSPCGVPGHFEFQLNGGNCLMCQREHRIRVEGIKAGIQAAAHVAETYCYDRAFESDHLGSEIRAIPSEAIAARLERERPPAQQGNEGETK